MQHKYRVSAVTELKTLPLEVQRYLLAGIRREIPQAQHCMVVIGWTEAMQDHIYRAMKFYAYKPGYRVIFHFENPTTIIVDRIARRDCDPYQDGH